MLKNSRLLPASQAKKLQPGKVIGHKRHSVSHTRRLKSARGETKKIVQKDLCNTVVTSISLRQSLVYLYWLFRLNNSLWRLVFSSATCRHCLLLQSTQSAGNCKACLSNEHPDVYREAQLFVLQKVRGKTRSVIIHKLYFISYLLGKHHIHSSLVDNTCWKTGCHKLHSSRWSCPKKKKNLLLETICRNSKNYLEILI